MRSRPVLQLFALGAAVALVGCPPERERPSGGGDAPECSAPRPIDHCVQNYLQCNADVQAGSTFWRRCNGADAGKVKHCTCADADADGRIDCSACMMPTGVDATTTCPADLEAQPEVVYAEGASASCPGDGMPQGDGATCRDDRGQTVQPLCWDADCYGDFLESPAGATDGMGWEFVPGSSTATYRRLASGNWALCDDEDVTSEHAGHLRCRCSDVDPSAQTSRRPQAGATASWARPPAYQALTWSSLTRYVLGATVSTTAHESMTLENQAGRTTARFGGRHVTFPGSPQAGSARTTFRISAGENFTLRYSTPAARHFELRTQGQFQVTRSGLPGWVGVRQVGYDCYRRQVELDANWGPIPVPAWVVQGAIPTQLRNNLCEGNPTAGSLLLTNVRGSNSTWFGPLLDWRLDSTTVELQLNGLELQRLLPRQLGGRDVSLRIPTGAWTILTRIRFDGPLRSARFRSASVDFWNTSLQISPLDINKIDIWVHQPGVLRVSVHYRIAGPNYAPSVFELRSDGMVRIVSNGPGFHEIANPQIQAALHGALSVAIPLIRQFDGVVPGFSLRQFLRFSIWSD